jgi:PAS domain S-box-containing protein
MKLREISPEAPRTGGSRSAPASSGHGLDLDLLAELAQSRVWLDVADAAFAESRKGLAIADARAPGFPLSYVSPAFERLTGYTAAECLGHNCSFLQGPRTDMEVVQTVREALAAHRPVRVVLRNYRKDGSCFWNELTIFYVDDAAGQPLYALGLQNDVTDLLEMRTTLRERQQFTSTVLDGIHAAIVTTDVRGSVTFANRMACSTLGLAAEECLGADAAEVLQLPPEARGCFSQEGEREKRFSYTFRRRDGSEADLGLSMSRTEGLSEHGLGHYFVFRDLAEIHQLEMGARRVERLAAMGTMVAGFAHEVRNPVASLRLLGEALGAELDPGDARCEYLSRMMTQVARIERLVKTSLRFGRPEQPRRAVHQPIAILAATLEAIVARTNELGGPIRVDIEPDLPAIYVDDAQLVQVLVILIDNALDAAKRPSGVRLHVHAEATSRGGERERERERPEGVRFEVIDDGPGIPPYMLTHVFDPFFTTKPNGTGLGLSIAQQLVHDNGGRIELSSQVGRGTTFAVLVVLGES